MKYFILIALTVSSWAQAMAHPYSPRREFFQLKRSGDFIDYRAGETYVEALGTNFIGLQSASNGSRTCLFGFQQKGLDEPGTYQIQTRFVCFPTQKYELVLKKEWCEQEMKGCEVDPGGISVGIGNLNVLPSYELDEPLPTFDTLYPKFLDVDVYKPLPVFDFKKLRDDV